MIIKLTNRILFKISLVVVFASMVPLLINALYSYHSSKHDLLRSLQGNAEITANQLAKAVVTPLWNMDDVAVTDLVLSRFQQNEVCAIVIRYPRILRSCMERNAMNHGLPYCGNVSTRKAILPRRHRSKKMEKYRVSSPSSSRINSPENT